MLYPNQFLIPYFNPFFNVNPNQQEEKRDNKPKIPRMWTIKQIAEYAKEHDPNSNITEYRLRLWCKEGKIPYTLSSNRTKLINVDKLDEYIKDIEGYNTGEQNSGMDY